MKIKIKDYVFNAAAKTVAFTFPLEIERLLVINNAALNKIIYNFADSATGGTVSGNILTLVCDTTGMTDGDKLLIYYEVDEDVQLSDILYELRALRGLLGFPDTGGRLRVNVENSVAVGTITTLSNVGTITTLSNTSSMGGYACGMATLGMSNLPAKFLRNQITIS